LARTSYAVFEEWNLRNLSPNRRQWVTHIHKNCGCGVWAHRQQIQVVECLFCPFQRAVVAEFDIHHLFSSCGIDLGRLKPRRQLGFAVDGYQLDIPR
jgi:hypothetical protein